MLLRILIALAVVVVVGAIAFVVERRRTTTAALSGDQVPERVDRDDFEATAAPWLVVMFSSDTCDSCAVMRDRITALGSDDVAVYEIEYGAGRALHERYGISAVPTTVIVDRDGAVRASWVGKASPDELHDTLEDLQARTQS